MPVTKDDLEQALWDIQRHGEDYRALGYREEDYRPAVAEIITLTSDANEEAGRIMTYGPTLAWGIAIGQLAERRRHEREGF